MRNELRHTTLATGVRRLLAPHQLRHAVEMAYGLTSVVGSSGIGLVALVN